MPEGVVFDLGYTPYDGPRSGRGGARWALYRDGLRRVLGLRRKARRKVLPALLLAGALLPAVIYVAVGIVAGELDAAAELFGHPEYFDLTGAISLVFIALAASELIVPDRVNGTMSLYASRPLTGDDYVLMRAASLATVVFAFVWLPHVFLYVGRAWTANEGLGSYATGNLDTLWQTALASAVYLVAYGSVGLLVASLSSRPSVAAAVFLAVVTISGPTTGSLVDNDIPVAGLGALQHHPGHVKDWIMDSSTHLWIPERAEYEPIVSLIAIGVVAVACGLVVRARSRNAA